MTVRRLRYRRRLVSVFTEGDNTEPTYVDAIKRLQDRYAVRVDDRHGKPRELVMLATTELARLTAQHDADGGSPDESPQVWCVFDRDNHPDVDVLIDRASEAGVKVAEHRFCPVCGRLPADVVALDALGAETARLDGPAQLPPKPQPACVSGASSLAYG